MLTIEKEPVVVWERFENHLYGVIQVKNTLVGEISLPILQKKPTGPERKKCFKVALANTTEEAAYITIESVKKTLGLSKEEVKESAVNQSYLESLLKRYSSLKGCVKNWQDSQEEYDEIEPKFLELELRERVECIRLADSLFSDIKKGLQQTLASVNNSDFSFHWESYHLKLLRKIILISPSQRAFLVKLLPYAKDGIGMDFLLDQESPTLLAAHKAALHFSNMAEKHPFLKNCGLELKEQAECIRLTDSLFSDKGNYSKLLHQIVSLKASQRAFIEEMLPHAESWATRELLLDFLINFPIDEWDIFVEKALPFLRNNVASLIALTKVGKKACSGLILLNKEPKDRLEFLFNEAKGMARSEEVINLVIEFAKTHPDDLIDVVYKTNLIKKKLSIYINLPEIFSSLREVLSSERTSVIDHLFYLGKKINHTPSLVCRTLSILGKIPAQERGYLLQACLVLVGKLLNDESFLNILSRFQESNRFDFDSILEGCLDALFLQGQGTLDEQLASLSIDEHNERLSLIECTKLVLDSDHLNDDSLAISHAIKNIPQDQRKSVIDATKQLQGKLGNNQNLSNIITALAKIPQNNRDNVASQASQLTHLLKEPSLEALFMMLAKLNEPADNIAEVVASIVKSPLPIETLCFVLFKISAVENAKRKEVLSRVYAETQGSLLPKKIGQQTWFSFVNELLPDEAKAQEHNFTSFYASLIKIKNVDSIKAAAKQKLEEKLTSYTSPCQKSFYSTFLRDIQAVIDSKELEPFAVSLNKEFALNWMIREKALYEPKLFLPPIHELIEGEQLTWNQERMHAMYSDFSNAQLSNDTTLNKMIDFFFQQLLDGFLQSDQFLFQICSTCNISSEITFSQLSIFLKSRLCHHIGLTYDIPGLSYNSQSSDKLLKVPLEPQLATFFQLFLPSKLIDLVFANLSALSPAKEAISELIPEDPAYYENDMLTKKGVALLLVKTGYLKT